MVRLRAGAAVALLAGGGPGRASCPRPAHRGAGAGRCSACRRSHGSVWALGVPGIVSVAGGLLFRLDALGALFLILVSMVAAPAALYGVGYSAAYEGRYSLRWLGAMLNLFLLATSLVPLADNVVTFLLTWEAMSVASYFLVLTERDEPETVSAANWYLGMTQVGLAFLLASFLRLGAEAPALDFADLRDAATALPDAARGLVFALALVGFGSKAGLIPCTWLPPRTRLRRATSRPPLGRG